MEELSLRKRKKNLALNFGRFCIKYDLEENVE